MMTSRFRILGLALAAIGVVFLGACVLRCPEPMLRTGPKGVLPRGQWRSQVVTEVRDQRDAECSPRCRGPLTSHGPFVVATAGLPASFRLKMGESD